MAALDMPGSIQSGPETHRRNKRGSVRARSTSAPRWLRQLWPSDQGTSDAPSAAHMKPKADASAKAAAPRAKAFFRRSRYVCSQHAGFDSKWSGDARKKKRGSGRARSTSAPRQRWPSRRGTSDALSAAHMKPKADASAKAAAPRATGAGGGSVAAAPVELVLPLLLPSSLPPPPPPPPALHMST